MSTNQKGARADIHSTEEQNQNARHAASGEIRIGSKTTVLLEGMVEAFGQLENEPLRRVLMESMYAEEKSVRAIGLSFEHFTQAKLPLDTRRTFFASWQKTNNSAMSVEGLANRLTDRAETLCAEGKLSQALELFRAGGRLNRVTDEDLGVKGQVLHFELYYRMATDFCDKDDSWQSRQYCLPAAKEFKAWLDASRLKEPLMTGMFSMLVHEGYTHAELEMIAPLFEQWATGPMQLSRLEAKRLLAWIAVHNGGTEKKHFAHSCMSLQHYGAATGDGIDLAAAGEMFRTYLRRKGEVMEQLDATF